METLTIEKLNEALASLPTRPCDDLESFEMRPILPIDPRPDRISFSSEWLIAVNPQPTLYTIIG